MTRHWTEALREALSEGPCVLVTITKVKGSAPRAPGCRMIVSAADQWGSIGGGNLEYQATIEARRILQEQETDFAREQLFGLGPALNQCCGGAVTLLFELLTRKGYQWLEEELPASRSGEQQCLLSVLQDRQTTASRFNPSDPWPVPVPQRARNVLLGLHDAGSFASFEQEGMVFLLERLRRQRIPLIVFGAGHVACALMPLLNDQPFEVHWVDGRKNIFPPDAGRRATLHGMENPMDIINRVPDGAAYLVMTHSHERDEDICDAVLKRKDIGWLGLIGSETKRRRFVHRLAARGHDESSLERLVCPVGISGIAGKRPATIAVTILAQLLRDCVPEDWR